MEQIITVRIIDTPQTVNGERCGVFADEEEHEVIVTDTPNLDALAHAIGKGVIAARGAAWTGKDFPIMPPNISVMGPAFSVGPPVPLRQLDP